MWITYVILLVIISLSVRIEAQTCQNASQYDQCSSNNACGCLPLTAVDNGAICAYLHLTCSELISCTANNRTCYEPGQVCVTHPRCHNLPVCYPTDMIAQAMCPPMSQTTSTPSTLIPVDGICASATWNSNGVTVAGGFEQGLAWNQLNYPKGLFVDDNNVVYVADTENHRVMKWMPGALNGTIVAGGNGLGAHNDQLNEPASVVVDKNGTLFICDFGNERVQGWFKNENHGQAVIPKITCLGLGIDNERSLYISSMDHVIKWPGGQIVAGGNGDGAELNQISDPYHFFVDRDQSVFVADRYNHRVVEWSVGTKAGIIVAGGNGEGRGANQLYKPVSVIVDQLGTAYVADTFNHRIMRWLKDSKSGTVIVGSRGQGRGSDQLSFPIDIKLDRHGNLYVADAYNHRIQMFAIDKSSCPSV